MRNKTIFCLLVVLLMAIPADSQYGNVYFSLTTNKTFLPGEKINLHLYANGVDALEFRVYKVNDTVRFFEKLDNVHNFGHFVQIGRSRDTDAARAISRLEAGGVGRDQEFFPPPVLE